MCKKFPRTCKREGEWGEGVGRERMAEVFSSILSFLCMHVCESKGEGEQMERRC